MPTVELDIRQLADKGGTEPFAPITVTDAVLDDDGNTLTDTLDEIKSGLMTVTNYSFNMPSGWTVNGAICKKVGQIVFLSGTLNASSSKTAKSFIFNDWIPEEIKPLQRIGFAAFDNATDTSMHCLLGGRNLQIYRPETTALTVIEFSVSYSLI